MFQRHATLLPMPPCPPKPSARESGRPYHGGSSFPSAADFRRVDRNDRFRIWVAAEGLERRTHEKGRHGGALGHSAMAVLRCLLFDFLNMGTGRLDPSYEEIAARTGYARDTVIEAVKRLDLVGVLEITRRIIRERVKVWLEAAGRYVYAVRVRQTSNAYRVNFPLPARREMGDLGAPLLNKAVRAGLGGGSLGVCSESESPTETTPVSLSSVSPSLESIQDPTLRGALERMRAAMAAHEVKK